MHLAAGTHTTARTKLTTPRLYARCPSYCNPLNLSLLGTSPHCADCTGAWLHHWQNIK